MFLKVALGYRDVDDFAANDSVKISGKLFKIVVKIVLTPFDTWAGDRQGTGRDVGAVGKA